nr:hypothetical protein [Microctonus hyperodae filamentous virus]
MFDTPQSTIDDSFVDDNCTTTNNETQDEKVITTTNTTISAAASVENRETEEEEEEEKVQDDEATKKGKKRKQHIINTIKIKIQKTLEPKTYKCNSCKKYVKIGNKGTHSQQCQGVECTKCLKLYMNEKTCNRHMLQCKGQK